jgi:hypothetical protein
MQPLAHCVEEVQLPRQAKPVALLRSCRAETVPALRTAAIIAASKIFLIAFLFMIHSPFR